MPRRPNDPTDAFADANAALAELTVNDARTVAFRAKFPTDSNGLRDLQQHSLDCARRSANAST